MGMTFHSENRRSLRFYSRLRSSSNGLCSSKLRQLDIQARPLCVCVCVRECDGNSTLLSQVNSPSSSTSSRPFKSLSCGHHRQCEMSSLDFVILAYISCMSSDDDYLST